jgi:hypothetical protein
LFLDINLKAVRCYKERQMAVRAAFSAGVGRWQMGRREEGKKGRKTLVVGVTAYA